VTAVQAQAFGMLLAGPAPATGTAFASLARLRLGHPSIGGA
jgi:hypothetical protein